MSARLFVPAGLKAASEEGVIEGYGAVFGNVDLGGDIILPGAFAKSLAKIKARAGTLPMLWHHKGDEPIGVWTDLTEDKKGLRVRGRLVMETQKARDAFALVKAGALSGLSIGYSNTTATRDAKTGVRSIRETTLDEISLATLPMNPEARVTGLKAAEIIRTERDFENFLRDAGGYSKTKARSITLHGFKAGTNRWDADATVGAGLTQRLDALGARLNHKLMGISHGTGTG